MNLLDVPRREMTDIRGSRIAMIFQQPTSSLNPVLDCGYQLGEVLAIHQSLKRSAGRERARQLLEMVGIPDPERRLDAYPHELSGGMAQRVMIAMALACDPQLLIADEPTTALDVTIQAQILDLMRNLQARTNTAIILITHDLGVVAEMASRIAVMYAGQIVEEAAVSPLFKDPKHPYTRGLLASIPVLGQVRDELDVIPGTCPISLICLPVAGSPRDAALKSVKDWRSALSKNPNSCRQEWAVRPAAGSTSRRVWCATKTVAEIGLWKICPINQPTCSKYAIWSSTSRYAEEPYSACRDGSKR